MANDCSHNHIDLGLLGFVLCLLSIVYLELSEISTPVIEGTILRPATDLVAAKDWVVLVLTVKKEEVISDQFK